MSQKVVATLPTSPRSGAALGFFLSQFVAYVIGRLQDIPVCGSANLLGTKGSSEAEADKYQEEMDSLGILPDMYWHDTSCDWREILSMLLSRGLSNGWIKKRWVSIYACPCGKTEFLDRPVNLIEGNFSRKVYEVRDGVPWCTVCRKPAGNVEQKALLMILPETIAPMSLMPEHARLSWSDLDKNLSGQEILISRKRDTGFSAVVAEENFFLDVDIAWMLYPFLLWTRGMQIGTLVCGHKVVKQAFLSTAVSGLMGVPLPSSVLLIPYMTIDFGDKEPLDARTVVSLYGRKTARCILGFGIGSKRKEIDIPSRMIHLVHRSVGGTVDPSVQKSMVPISTEELWRSFNIQTLQNALSLLRGKGFSEMNPYVKRFMGVILG